MKNEPTITVMKFSAFALTAYILLILLQPAYMGMVNLFCTSCGGAGACSKQQTYERAGGHCYQQENAVVKHGGYDHSARMAITCSSCNPFLLCSGISFLFSVPQSQHSIFQEKEISFSENRFTPSPFIHEVLHPPQHS